MNEPVDDLRIRLFGGLEITRNGAQVALPQSRKTRALLAYLIVKGTPQRRDDLCELLWDVPDDPRGSLRWALSKLRPLVNSTHVERLIADRERITFRATGAGVDVLEVEGIAARGFPDHGTDTLRRTLDECRGTLLAGMELPQHPEWESWRMGQQERARQLQLAIINTLASRQDVGRHELLAMLRRRTELDPGNIDAHLSVVERLLESGDAAGARAQAEVSEKLLKASGAPDDMRLMRALQDTRRPVIMPASISNPAPAVSEESTPDPGIEPAVQFRQTIRFCRSKDGTRIAYSTAGNGTPLVKTPSGLTHLEFDWEGPIQRETYKRLTRHHTLVRYDARGSGLSDWKVPEISIPRDVDDLEAVVDAAGLSRFALFGWSQGCAIALEFALRFPSRVSKLVLGGGYLRGWHKENNPVREKTAQALITLIRNRWHVTNPAFQQVFTSLFMPDARPDQNNWANMLQARSTSGENLAKQLTAFGDIVLTDRVGVLSQPALVLHATDDALVPQSLGREMAEALHNSRFLPFDSRNHLLLDTEPSYDAVVSEIIDFRRFRQSCGSF